MKVIDVTTSHAGLVATLSLSALAGCAGDRSVLPPDAGTGRNPVLPAPKHNLIPTLQVAAAVGWNEGSQPSAAPGLTVSAFADGLQHPRWLHVLPNGDVLVAETSGPAGQGAGGDIKAWVMKRAQAKAGAAVPSANRITLLRDADGNGRAELRAVFAEGLNSPFGMALVGDLFYVANTDAVVCYRYADGKTRAEGPPMQVAALPAGPINHHWTKDLIASPDGRFLYATVGSNSNVAENGLDAERNRAAVLQIERATGQTRLYASGLRNPNGLAWEPHDGRLWVAVNERDELGSDLVPDYITAVVDGGFYGWPYSYFGQHYDARVIPQRPDLVARALHPDFAVGPHTGSLGLAFSRNASLLPQYPDGAFVGQHGSWNRRPPLGYRVIFVPFTAGRAHGPVQEVLTGFLDENGAARGRPVGVAIDRAGALLVADDVGNTIWRVASKDALSTAGADRRNGRPR
jgi:glucose/arabinose dehydrogenase